MNKTYTTIEQANALVEAGLNPETADMHYNEYIIDGKSTIDEYPQTNIHSTKIVEFKHPCWTLGALIDLLPENVYNQKHETSFIRQLNVNDVVYENTLVFNSKETLFENVYDAVCFFAEHGFSTRYGYFDDAK